MKIEIKSKFWQVFWASMIACVIVLCWPLRRHFARLGLGLGMAWYFFTEPKRRAERQRKENLDRLFAKYAAGPASIYYQPPTSAANPPAHR